MEKIIVKEGWDEEHDPVAQVEAEYAEWIKWAAEEEEVAEKEEEVEDKENDYIAYEDWGIESSWP